MPNPRDFVSDPKDFGKPKAKVRFVLPPGARIARQRLDEAAAQHAIAVVVRELLSMEAPRFENQKTLAKHCDVNHTVVSRWLNGWINMDADWRAAVRALMTAEVQADLDKRTKKALKKAAKHAAKPPASSSPIPYPRDWVTGPPAGFLEHSATTRRPREPIVTGKFIPEVEAMVVEAVLAERDAAFPGAPPLAPSEVEVMYADYESDDASDWSRVEAGFVSGDDGDDAYVILSLPANWGTTVWHPADGKSYAMIGGKFVVAVIGSRDHIGPTRVLALRAMPSIIDDELFDWTWGCAEARVVYDDTGEPVDLTWVYPDRLDRGDGQQPSPAEAAIIRGQHVPYKMPIDRVGAHEKLGYSPRPWWPGGAELQDAIAEWYAATLRSDSGAEMALEAARFKLEKLEGLDDD